MRLLALLVWALYSSSTYAQIFSSGCSASALPGPVKNLNVVINRYGDGGRINFKQPQGTACINYYEVKMVENGPTPRAVTNVPSQTKDTSVQVKGLRPGQEYLVTVTAVNGRGRGPAVQQTVIPVKATSCTRKPAAVKDLTAQYLDAKTMTLQWQPGDDCYGGADVQVVETATNKRVYTASVRDTYVKVSSLRPKTAYQATVVPYSDNTQQKGPASSLSSRSPCDPSLAPGSVTGLSAQPSSPAGTILVDIRGVSNDACVASWELSARGQGNVVKDTIKVDDPSSPSVYGLRLNGRPNQRYTIQATAVNPAGVRGITGQIGPILAEGKTQQEAAAKGPAGR